MTGTLTHSQARGMAEAMWGRGGTTAYRTNRAGAFYFSCSGHGGYVLDDAALTEAERELLTRATFSPAVCHGVRDQAGRIIRFRHPYATRWTQLYYYASRGETLDRVRVWVFEEDCDWAAVQALTGIRSAGFSLPDAELSSYARESLGRWHPIAAELLKTI